MNESIIVFEHPSFGPVRTIDREGDPWFVAKDIATALGYADTGQAVRKHCKKAKPLRNSKIASPHIIPESDLYRLIMKSRLKTASKFRNWIFEDVLPTMSKCGKLNYVTLINTLSSESIDTSGFIYFVHAEGTNRYKIGVTLGSIETRLKQLQTNQGVSPYKFDLSLVCAKKVQHAYLTEAYFHSMFGYKCVHGEWFTLEVSEVEAVVTLFDRAL